MTSHTPQSPSSSQNSRRGFTLIEILVAVGAVALIAVGLAAVFDSVGKTVSGGRKLSRYNALSTQIELQLRRDINSMTRDGILMIRQQFASNGSTPVLQRPVYLSERDQDISLPPRLRRIDELLFIGRGEYIQAGEPISPDYIATSDTARIYYGHGQRRIDSDVNYGVPGTNRVLRYDDDPGVSGAGGGNAIRGQILGGILGNNRYAGDWALLRQQTLLINPSLTRRDLAAVGAEPRNSPLLQDSGWQIALQPAQSSLFRKVARILPDATNRPVPTSLWSQYTPITGNVPGLRPPSNRPNTASGLVEIIASDPSELRSFITTCPIGPDGVGNYSQIDPTAAGALPWQAEAGWPTAGSLADAALTRTHQWMAQVFPTQSDAWAPIIALDPSVSGSRIRYEAKWPDPTQALPATANNQLAAAYARRDQTMLGSSVLLERCSEFIVEWSFGQWNPSLLSLVWYGGAGPVDASGQRPISFYNDAVATYHSFEGFTRYQPFKRKRNTNPPIPTSATPLNESNLAGYVPSTRLIYGTQTPNPLQCLTSHFGYHDPTYTPAADDQIRTIPWVWPKLIRITIRIADERDPTQEETFQYVFELPAQVTTP
ncbi:MAG: prepilin-type N-terminal cleavage/methylation domain-containing protein [Planctomycetes bacterium]|nr:prepilin-type N-terminal cleavage/methylation domain-containing protein [Planctomycetota bacterium]